MPNEHKDVVQEARELARTPMEAHQFARRSRELLKTLADEVEALREELAERRRDILNLEDEAYRHHA